MKSASWTCSHSQINDELCPVSWLHHHSATCHHQHAPNQSVAQQVVSSWVDSLPRTIERSTHTPEKRCAPVELIQFIKAFGSSPTPIYHTHLPKKPRWRSRLHPRPQWRIRNRARNSQRYPHHQMYVLLSFKYCYITEAFGCTCIWFTLSESPSGANVNNPRTRIKSPLYFTANTDAMLPVKQDAYRQYGTDHWFTVAPTFQTLSSKEWDTLINAIPMNSSGLVSSTPGRRCAPSVHQLRLSKIHFSLLGVYLSRLNVLHFNQSN